MSSPSPNQIRKLFSSKNWVIFTGLIILAFLLSIRLGLWQYDRHQARVELNNSISSALATASEEIDFNYQDYLPWQKITVEGSFLPGTQQLVRRRYLEGQLGFWVVAKFQSFEGQRILVNRGFIPVTLAANQSPEVLTPPSGSLTLEGYLQKLEKEVARPADLPAGQVNAINRTQFNLESSSFDFYLHQINTTADLQAIAAPKLTFGSHLAYSLQWFAFAFMIVIGWILLTRKEITELNKLN